FATTLHRDLRQQQSSAAASAATTSRSVLVGACAREDNRAMTHQYGQYCPLALAVELLCERWTLLVVSRLIDGCTQFNEIHRGVPRISPSLLSRRLSQLERAGLVQRGPAKKGLPRTCALTPAGQELAPIIDALAVWGQRWSRDMNEDDLDI